MKIKRIQINVTVNVFFTLHFKIKCATVMMPICASNICCNTSPVYTHTLQLNWHDIGHPVASPQLSSWWYWEQSLRSPLRSRHGWLSRASYQLMRAECGGQLHAWCKETLMQWCITNEKLAWIIDANIWCPQVQFLEFSRQHQGVWLAAVINNRCPNTNAFTSFIHKMGIFF